MYCNYLDNCIRGLIVHLQMPLPHVIDAFTFGYIWYHLVISTSNLRTLRSVHQAEMLEDATWAGGIFRIISLLLVTIKAQTSRISHDACRYGPLLALGLYHSVNVLVSSLKILKRHNESN